MWMWISRDRDPAPTEGCVPTRVDPLISDVIPPPEQTPHPHGALCRLYCFTTSTPGEPKRPWREKRRSAEDSEYAFPGTGRLSHGGSVADGGSNPVAALAPVYGGSKDQFLCTSRPRDALRPPGLSTSSAVSAGGPPQSGGEPTLKSPPGPAWRRPHGRPLRGFPRRGLDDAASSLPTPSGRAAWPNRSAIAAGHPAPWRRGRTCGSAKRSRLRDERAPCAGAQDAATTATQHKHGDVLTCTSRLL